MTFEAPGVKIVRGDCMAGMAGMRDGEFELAICDPPYNVGASDGNFGGKKLRPSMVGGKENAKNYANYDKTPDAEYFKELFRVSKNQIIWGSNYYPQYLHHSGAIVWDKKNDNNHVLSDCEIAFQSFNKQVVIFRNAWCGFYKQDASGSLKFRIHPNQKPVTLYEWLLKNYAKPGDHILDTHGGSMSSVIAANIMGYSITCYEIDEDYYKAGVDRVKRHLRQGVLDL